MCSENYSSSLLFASQGQWCFGKMGSHSGSRICYPLIRLAEKGVESQGDVGSRNKVSPGVSISRPIITWALASLEPGRQQTLGCHTWLQRGRETHWSAASFIRVAPKKSEKGNKITRHAQENFYLISKTSSHLLLHLAPIWNIQALSVFRRSSWLLWSWNWPIDVADTWFHWATTSGLWRSQAHFLEDLSD